MLTKCFKELSLFLEDIRIPPHLEYMLAVKDGSTFVGFFEGVRQRRVYTTGSHVTQWEFIKLTVKPILEKGGGLQQRIERFFLKWIHAQQRHNLMCSVFIWLSYKC